MTENEAFECDLDLFLEKSSKNLQRRERGAKLASEFRSRLSETEKQNLSLVKRSFEVLSHLQITIQVRILLSLINFRPRGVPII